jgi:hypothetical protein
VRRLSFAVFACFMLMTATPALAQAPVSVPPTPQSCEDRLDDTQTRWGQLVGEASQLNKALRAAQAENAALKKQLEAAKVSEKAPDKK